MRAYTYLFDPDQGPSTRRMMAKLRWREADQKADEDGRPARLTLWAAEARHNFFTLLARAINRDEMFRIRHRYWDEPCLLVRESRYRDLERRAAAEEPRVRE